MDFYASISVSFESVSNHNARSVGLFRLRIEEEACHLCDVYIVILISDGIMQKYTCFFVDMQLI